MVSSDAVINAQLLSTVLAAGHSRVPVHDGENRQACCGALAGSTAPAQRCLAGSKGTLPLGKSATACWRIGGCCWAGVTWPGRE